MWQEGTDEEETYVFSFDNNTIFQTKKDLLIENGFFDRKKRIVKDAERRINQ